MAEFKENLRDGILKTGVNILSNLGFGRLTQPQVSRDLGITQSRLTYYFPKRIDMMIGVVEYATDIIAKEVGKRISGPLSSEKLFSLVSWIVRDRKRTQLILNIFFESQESDELKKRIKKIIIGHQDLVARAIGRAPGDPDAAIVMAAIWGLGLQHYILDGDRKDKETIAILRRLEEWIEICAQRKEESI